MTGETNIFRVGEAHLEEVMRLVESNSLTPEEVGAINAQIDLLYQQSTFLKPASDVSFTPCNILARLSRHEGIESMVLSGANPRVVRAIRNRRARTYAGCLRKLEADCERRIRCAAFSASHAGEWVIYSRILGRRFRLRWYLQRLRFARRAYLMGFRVDVIPTLQRMKLLLDSTE